MPRDVVIDVGAGMWKMYNNYLIDNTNLIIFAFEPHPDIYKKLSDLKTKWATNNKQINDRLKISNSAVSNCIKKNVNFYNVNDPVASSLCPLNKKGIAKWKYPFNRKKFKVESITKVDTVTLTDFIQKQPNLKYSTINLLNINMQGNYIDVLNGVTNSLFRKIKRIVIKCIDTPFELYKNQSDIVDVIDKLKINDFTLIRGEQYSRKQEQILEFVNTRFNPTQSDLNPTFKIIDTGEFIIHL